jgi:hypothetical protein
MTDQTTDTHSHTPATEPLALELTWGLGAWSPIETAPRDGTTVLLWEQYEDEPFIGSWHNFRSRWVASTTHYGTDDNACVVDSVYSDGVTNWMPLPAPPVSA